jgi:hypothetical protein
MQSLNLPHGIYSFTVLDLGNRELVFSGIQVGLIKGLIQTFHCKEMIKVIL